MSVIKSVIINEALEPTSVQYQPTDQEYPNGAIDCTNAGYLTVTIDQQQYTIAEIWIGTISETNKYDVYVNGGLQGQTENQDLLFPADDLITHLENLSKHREINDGGTAVTDLWSGSYINNLITTHTGDTANPHEVTAAQLSLDKVLNLKHNFTATRDPIETDDAGDGYAQGSLWANLSTPELFICENPVVGSAVWNSLSPDATIDPLNITLADNGDRFSSLHKNVESAIAILASQLGLENSTVTNTLQGTTFLDGISHVFNALRKLDTIISQRVFTKLETIGAWDIYSEVAAEDNPDTNGEPYALEYRTAQGAGWKRTHIIPFYKSAGMNSLQLNAEVTTDTGSDLSGSTLRLAVRDTYDGANLATGSIVVGTEYDNGYQAGNWGKKQAVINVSEVSSGHKLIILEMIIDPGTGTFYARNHHILGLPT